MEEVSGGNFASKGLRQVGLDVTSLENMEEKGLGGRS
jgi:hypothetical protein